MKLAEHGDKANEKAPDDRLSNIPQAIQPA